MSALGAAALVLSACSGERAETPAEASPEAAAPADTAAAPPAAAPLYPATEVVAAPDFSLPQLDGGTFRLSALAGDVVVLNVWATWCGPCREEMPDFVALQEELGPRGVRVVGVSVDEEGASVVRPFVDEIGVNYPVVVDDGTVEELYGPFQVVPTTYVIGRQGKIRRYAPGMLTREALRPVLLDLIEEDRA